VAVLGIDTSSALSVAVGLDGASADQYLLGEVAATRQHAERLASAIKQLLRENDVEMSELSAIAVGVGPGPFTGLRVGITTARALGLALGIPVWGVPSHDAIALMAGPLGISDLLVVTDARRKEVYWSRYRPPGDLPAVTGPGVVKPAHLAQVLDGTDPADVVVLGEGVRRYRTQLAEAGFDVERSEAILNDDPGYEMLLYPAASAIAALGVARARGADVFPSSFCGCEAEHCVSAQHRLGIQTSTLPPAQPTTPLYLRRPDVQPPAAASAR